MIKNYIIVAFRNLRQHKHYAILNILGLTIGIACFIFISLLVQYELGYDQFHLNKERLYRVVTDKYVGTPSPLGPLCVKEIPEVAKCIRLKFYSNDRSFRYQNNTLIEKRFILADPAFFEVFSFQVLKGDPRTILNAPNSIVITQTNASRYFGKEEPIGKVLIADNGREYVVTGIIKDVPENSHFQFDMVAQFPQNMAAKWGEYNYLTYLLLTENVDPKNIQKKVNEVFFKNTNNTNEPFKIQKVTDIHLRSHIRGEVGTNGFISNIYLYSIIAFIVLIMACINYANLATAQYSMRVKEVCVRKVFGANIKNLIFQFLGETLLFILIALDIALIAVVSFLPYVNNLLGKQMQIGNLNLQSIILSIAGIIFLTIILSGSYPIIYLSSLSPISLMKGGGNRVNRGSVLKKSLLFFQFSFSIFFLIFSMITSKQMSFINTTKLGFDKENIITIPIVGEVDKRFETLKSELMQYPKVKQISINSFLLSGDNYNQNVWWEGLQENDWDHFMRWIPVDTNFVRTFNLKLIQGTDKFDRNAKVAYILNESALKYTCLNDPVGKKFNIIGKGTILGVVEDFHTKSLRDSIVPCALVIAPNNGSYISIRVLPGDFPTTIRRIEDIWDNLIKDRPFSYFFFDEDYNSLYREEQRTSRIFTYATILAIAISILGIIGLLALTAEQRTKEIAIRKVIGSSISRIFVLMNKDFSILILIANAVTWPITYYFLNNWLQNFAYRTTISFWIFLLSGTIVLVISFCIVIWKSWSVASRNPVDALRYE